jgi:hypothetical protein
MTQNGTHTWDIIIHYHRCPGCGFIIESREDYHYRMGKYQKDLTCSRCQRRFTITKPTRLRFGPLIGNPQPPEVDWGMDDES